MIAVLFLIIISSITSQEITTQKENDDPYTGRHMVVDNLQDLSLTNIVYPSLNKSIFLFNQTLNDLQKSYQSFMEDIEDHDLNDNKKRQNQKRKDNTLFRNFAQTGFIFYTFNSTQPATLFIHESLILPKNANSIDIADRELFDLNHDISVLKFLVEDVKQKIKLKQRMFRAKLKAANKQRKEKKNRLQEELFN